ncbi:hypothetical protein [Xenorhabdus kozodoii]|nr:hypothetical protein [Xenorhabdus kozodoii]
MNIAVLGNQENIDTQELGYKIADALLNNKSSKREEESKRMNL